MVVNERDYRKPIYLRGYSHEFLDSLDSVELRVRRPDGSTFVRELLPADRDLSGNFTWLIASGELSISGDYLFQPTGIKGSMRVSCCAVSVHVCDLLQLI